MSKLSTLKPHHTIGRKLRDNWVNYVWQSLAAGLFIFLVFYVFSELIGAVVMASIGSTFFTVFALPHNRAAQHRNVIGSHVFCILVGLLCSLISSVSLSAGIAVGVAALLMVITDTEHPPAAGIALGLALTQTTQLAFTHAAFAFVTALLAALLRQLFSPWLKDLRLTSES